MSQLTVGSLAPDFHLVDQAGQAHQLLNYRGRWLLLYFYPRDNTPGCTLEACGLRDHWHELQELDLTILGVSADSVSSHDKFARRLSLPFPLLADPDKVAIAAYGVLTEKKMFGKSFLGIKRSSFLINPEGKISKIYQQVQPAKHAVQVLNDLLRLQS